MSVNFTAEEERIRAEYTRLGAAFRAMNEWLTSLPPEQWTPDNFNEKKFLRKYNLPKGQETWYGATMSAYNLAQELRIPLTADWSYMAELLYFAGTSQGHTLMDKSRYKDPSDGGLLRKWAMFTPKANSASYNVGVDWDKAAGNCLYPPVDRLHYYPRRQITANRKPAYFLSPDRAAKPRDAKLMLHALINCELMNQEFRYRNWFEFDACNMLCQSLASPYRFDFLEVSDISDERNPRVINIEETPIQSQGNTLNKHQIMDKLNLLNGRSALFQRNAKNKNVAQIEWRWKNDRLYDPMTNTRITDPAEYEALKRRAYIKGAIPAMESLMIKLSNEMSEFGVQVHFQFTGAVELTRFFKNTLGMASQPHPDLFKDNVFKEEMFKDKPLTEKITGFPLLLSAPIPVQFGVQRDLGIRLNKDLHGNSKIPNFEEKFKAMFSSQTVNVFFHHVVTISNDKFVPWKEGLIPHTQDMAFWSFMASTSTPLLAEEREMTDYMLSKDKPPTVISGYCLKAGHRKNLMIINSRKQRAEHLLAMHKNQFPDPERVPNAPPVARMETYSPTMDHRISDFANESPLLKTFHKPPSTITDNPSATSVHAKLAITLIRARDELWIENEGFTNNFEERQFSTITSRRGTAVVAAGDWISISGSETFPMAQFAQRRDLLIAQAHCDGTYAHVGAIKDFQIHPVSADIR